MKKALIGVLLAGVMVAGGFAASVALAASHASDGWTAGNCAAGAENSGARSSAITAVLSGSDSSGLGCSVTIMGKFVNGLPAKGMPVGGFVHVTPVAGAAPGTYAGTIKTRVFHGTLTLAAAPTNTTMTLPNSGCGWTYAFIGGHWVALYTTC